MVVRVFYKNCSKEACAISVKGLHGGKCSPYSVTGDDGANRVWFVKGFTLVCVALSGYSEDWPVSGWMMPSISSSLE